MKRAKTLAAGLLALCLTVALAAPALASEVTVKIKGLNGEYTIGSNDFTVKYNGEAVVFPDAQPFATDNRTLVPIRFVAETMGADVIWDQPTLTASITKGDTTVKITIGEKALKIIKAGETTTVQMDTVAVGKDGRTFIPVRFVAEALGAWVGYSDLFTTAQIYADQLTPEEITRLRGYYDMAYVEWLKAQKTEHMELYGTDAERVASYPQIAYFTGTNGFSNANEWKLRNPNDVGIRAFGYKTKPTNYVGTVSSKTYTFDTQPDIDFSKLMLTEAVQGVNKELNKPGTLTVNLRSDLSCVYNSRHSNEAATYVRGVLDVTIPKGADMTWIRQNCDFLTSPKAGESYSVDVEVYVDTFTEEVFWREIVALK